MTRVAPPRISNILVYLMVAHITGAPKEEPSAATLVLIWHTTCEPEEVPLYPGFRHIFSSQ
jgi:hypothetical protein